MKPLNVTFLLLFFLSLTAHSQTLDTLVDVGGYKMHFKIIKGEGTPILFEAGGGDDHSVWDNIIENIHNVTGTTIITYDRSGFGQSELQPNFKNDSDYGIKNGIKELETSLYKLGFNKEIILVSHSYGGLYNLLYAHQNPKKVKSIILIDATPNEFWNEELLTMRDQHVDLSTIEKPSGDYYLNANFKETMRYVKNISFPENIPIVSIFPEDGFAAWPEMLSKRWKKLQLEFGNKENVTNIIAKRSGHAVFQDNPTLVINAIIRAYANILDKEKQHQLLQNALDNAIVLSNEDRLNNRSEQDVNALGYSFLGNEEVDKALEVFKLNITLFPNSANVYDSYGEALMISNKTTEALEMYEKSIELNPNNEHAKEMIKQLRQK